MDQNQSIIGSKLDAANPNKGAETGAAKAVQTGVKLWEPDAERKARSHMTRFASFAAARTGRIFADFQSLYRWSIDDLGSFWAAVAAYDQEILWQAPASAEFVPPPKGKLRGGRFFPGSQLNYAEHLLREAQANPERELVVGLAEAGQASAPDQPLKRRVLSGAQLVTAVTNCAASLQAQGIKKGDRVAGVMANTPEALTAMLATTSLGAIWSSCSPDFGVNGIVDRLSQINPALVFFTTNYFYNGKSFDCMGTIAGCLGRLPDVRTAVLVDHNRLDDTSAHDQVTERLQASPVWQQQLANNRVAAVTLKSWQAYLAAGAATERTLSFVATGFDDPLFIMFSSGTTGVPKCITHGVGGTLLQHKKELLLHSDLDTTSTLLFYTTCGWMMWNWMVSGLAVGARLVLYDGSPAYPDVSGLWRVVGQERVTHFGTSPKFISSCMSANTNLAAVDFTALQSILSTGAPLLPEQFAWIYARVKADLHLASISGGTDIISCFMLGVPTLPVHAGEIQHAGLGMAVEAWNDNGQSVRSQKAELICTRPFVSMPVGFWNDPDGRKYKKAYFSHFPGRAEVWRHGDFIEITKSGGIVVYGRSDATLNPGGVRIGTAELYRQVETLPEILDSIAVGRQVQGDEQIVLFVKLKPSQKLTPDLVGKIKSTIRTNLTPRHVPHDIVEVSDIPYTRSGKKVEMAVTQAIHGEKIANLAAIANAEVMDEFVSYGRGEDEDEPKHDRHHRHSRRD